MLVSKKRSGFLEPDFCGSGLPSLLNIEKIANKGLTGRLPTSVKKFVNSMSKNPNARPPFKGELHPVSFTSGKPGWTAFNNYLGPNTQVSKRLLRGDEPISRTDKVGQAHDIRFALAKNPSDLRRADIKLLNKLNRLKKEGEPRLNILPGELGIKAKMKLEERGIWKKDKFFNPIKDKKVIGIAKRKLKQLEQEGYGLSPAQMLKRHILAPKKLNLTKILSGPFIREVITDMKRRGYRNMKKFKGGQKKLLEKEIDLILTKQYGSGIVTTGLLVASSLLPVAVDLAKLIVPKILNLIKGKRKMSQKGKGALFKILGFLIKEMLKVARLKREEREMSGSGKKQFLEFIKNFARSFAQVLEKGIEIGVPLTKDVLVPILSALSKK
jgi:hypothetical protein